MTDKNKKPAARDRAEWGRNPTISPDGAGKLLEGVALVTAAGAATLGVLNAREAHAAQDPSLPVDNSRSSTDHAGSVAGQAAAGDAQRLQDLHHAGPASPNLPSAHDNGQAVERWTVEQWNGNHNHDQNAPQPHATAFAPATGHPVQFDGDPIVARLADHITSSVGSVLDAVRSGGSGDLSQVLAKNIFDTAASIVQDIRSHLPDLGHDLAQITGTLNGAVAHLADDLPSITHDLHETVASLPVIDLLSGHTTDAGPVLPSVHGIVGELSGVGLEGIAHPLADGAQSAATIPSAMLGGVDSSKGLLADIFYDDGGGHGTTGIAAHGVQAAEPAGLGFLGQPLSAAEELTGIFHGSSALHLV